MDEREFLRMLERFPVVRKKTHARVEWNSIYDVENDASSKANIASSVEATSHSAMDITASDSLQVALTKFLQAYYSVHETRNIQREFEKAQADFLSGLSLEDVEDLCAQFVTTPNN